MKKQNVTTKTTTKQTAKKAPVSSALIESLVRQDLESVGSDRTPSCAIAICKF